ncbi:MAG TPA: alpha/beta hydrolase [Burkholderiaceae bacterium]|nr:alpha/beta hydrolase [Burkholderiaceae bacterium]
MPPLQHRFVQSNGIRLHVAEQGEGPLVVLCHGFPESWYSWRHQLKALAEAGYRAVAPDMRGYGQSDAPDAITEYSMLHLVGDMVGLVLALGVPKAVVVGHDWGAPVAWHCALLRPDLFTAVAALSVPYRGRGPVQPTTAMPRTDDAEYYQLYFQPPGQAERELSRDVRRTIRAVLYGASGDAPASQQMTMVSRGGGFVSSLIDPTGLPSWLRDEDVDFYVAEFERTGFRGGLNWYRNIDRNWELLAPYAGAKVGVPALFVAGDRDQVVTSPGAQKVIAGMSGPVPRLQRTLMLPGCGHWTQQERPQAVNDALLEFLRGIGHA